MEVVEIMDVVSVANLHRCRSKGYLKGSMINLPHPSDRNKQIYTYIYIDKYVQTSKINTAITKKYIYIPAPFKVAV